MIDDFSEFLNDNEWVQVDFYDLKAGDKVYIMYCPDSQKYIDYLVPKWGYVESGNCFDNLILRLDDALEKVVYPNLSYYGDYRGYSWTIYRAIPGEK